MFCALLAFVIGCRRNGDDLPKGPVTFNQHIAPIVFAHCSSCHRPGQSGRFSLLNYSNVQSQARAILEAVETRYMPPWLADGPMGEFIEDRRLSDRDIALLRRWVAEGTPEGNANELPPTPQFPDDWPLGKPDLIVTLPEPYTMPAQGADIYRNFVLPLNVPERKFVRAMDVRPGSPSVHHGFLAFDANGIGRKWDARDAEPGFASFTLPSGLELPPEFLGWHPGKQAAQSPPGLEWALEPKRDLILQLHIRPKGRADKITPQVAFYFTSHPPTNEPIKLQISTLRFMIPAGASNHVVREALQLPGDSDLLGLAPHSHFIAREFIARARFPNNTSRVLLHIPRWDFNWQEAYRFKQPVLLPAGTSLEMEWAYDNSNTNPRNPNTPPRDIGYGLESTNEMAVLTAQILPRDQSSARRINQALMQDVVKYNLDLNTFLLARDSKDVRAHVGLARALWQMGDLERAAPEAATARQLDSSDEDAALLAGMIAQFRKQPLEARKHFEDCVRLNHDHPRAHGCLAVLSMEQGWFEVAEMHLYEALRIDANDSSAKELLRQLRQRTGRR
jgi:hypothetical protein